LSFSFDYASSSEKFDSVSDSFDFFEEAIEVPRVELEVIFRIDEESDEESPPDEAESTVSFGLKVFTNKLAHCY
jgi:hypothetical protein